MLCGNFAHQIRVVSEGSAAVPVQTCTARVPVNKSSVVLLRVVMRDAMRAVSDACPEVIVEKGMWATRSSTFKQKEQRDAREPARKVFWTIQEANKQGGLKLSTGEGGREGERKRGKRKVLCTVVHDHLGNWV